MHRHAYRGLALAASLILAGWTGFHLELAGSSPEADAVLAGAPAEVWLLFSVVPDMAKTGFSVVGPDGNVALGEIQQGEGEEASMLRAAVSGPMPPGSYTVSWVGAPMDDHTVRGRFGFVIAGLR